MRLCIPLSDREDKTMKSDVLESKTFCRYLDILSLKVCKMYATFEKRKRVSLTETPYSTGWAH